ncbi:MAG: DUF1045 domain-containing protein, partial [Pseudomonadota bacterium]
RYAVYWTAEAGSQLAQAGASWLGWDAAKAEPRAHPDVGVELAGLTDRPCKYGFHGTIKAPFRLLDAQSAPALVEAFERRASEMAPFELPPLVPRWLGPFMALVPSAEAPALAAFAGDWVQSLEAFRAPLSAQDIARRRKSGLTELQDAHLLRWGYPYVFEEFRFHVTLTGPVADPAVREAAHKAAQAWFGPMLGAPVPVREICLFGEADDGRFAVIARARLGV